MKSLWSGSSGNALATALVLSLGAPACSGDEKGAKASGDGGTGGSGTSGAGGRSGGGRNSGGRSGGGGATSPGLPHVPGEPDPSVETALPPLPRMTNVRASAIADNVNITFDPIDGARDYRVYVLPADADVSSDSSGHITVRNAVYRCAGDRQMPPVTMDGAEQVPGGTVVTLVDGVDARGYTRSLAEATLGHVYLTAGDGRVPVYAMGNPGPRGENDIFIHRWGATRDKVYITSESERTRLLGERWRDDGIVFYVPAAAGSGTRAVVTKSDQDNRFYYVDGPEATSRGAGEEAFQILAESGGADTRPLMRVFYAIAGQSHDELVPGQAWFDRVRQQGENMPMFDLHWAGITGETILVVEALADGCPAQGFFAPKSSPAATTTHGVSVPAWQTLDELRAAGPSGQVYINGQHDAANDPRPIARSFVKISPGPRPDLDWFESFDADSQIADRTDTPCGHPVNCFQQWREVTPVADVSLLAVETERWGYAAVMGELWVAYDDWGADVNGKSRITATQKGQMNADSFLHVTMTVDSFTTGRRYPQLMISDQDIPVQFNMVNGNTLVLETFFDWPNAYILQICDHREWDVNMQCPGFDMFRLFDPGNPDEVTGFAPVPDIGERVGVDRAMRWDIYTSTQRAYVFIDGEPYGCADLPAAGVPSGAVTVTFGDVLYHSGVDKVFDYHAEHLQIESRRHFDNLGFKSGLPAPEWDENRFPCVSRIRDY